MAEDKTYTLAEIKKALQKHNKDVENDVRVKLTPEGLKFSSAKAELIKVESEKEIADVKQKAEVDVFKAKLSGVPATKKKPAPKKKKPDTTMKGGDITKFLVKE
jgi:DNA-binding transcriptional MerR regulator